MKIFLKDVKSNKNADLAYYFHLLAVHLQHLHTMNKNMMLSSNKKNLL